jgi:hypothetical protein
MTDIAAAMRAVWGYSPPRKYVEMHEARLFVAPTGPRARWRDDILRGNATGQPPRVLLALAEIDGPDVIASGNAFVSEMLVPGLVPIGGDGSGDAYCFDTRGKIGGTTPVLYVPHDGGGAVYVAPSFAGFVHFLILQNLQSLHFYEGWGLTRADLIQTSLRSAEAAARWLLPRWRRRIIDVLASDVWPTSRTLPALLAEDPAFARMPRGEQDVFR